jgi:hypothetical protein
MLKIILYFWEKIAHGQNTTPPGCHWMSITYWKISRRISDMEVSNARQPGSCSLSLSPAISKKYIFSSEVLTSLWYYIVSLAKPEEKL